MSREPRKDDALFEALGKSKKQKKRKLIRTIVIILLVLAVVLVTVITTLQRRVQEKFASNNAQVEAYEVTTGTISTLVSGYGMLVNVDTESYTVPDGVEVTEVLVKAGEPVTEGDLLATVDIASVRTALSSLQEEIKTLDSQIADSKSDSVGRNISTGVAGRVKAVYAEIGDKVMDVMVEHGALALISLDGHMALDLDSETLEVGDSVIVIREDGTQLEGSVASGAVGKATILVTDDGPKQDEEVTVQDMDGNTLGSGKLYIHNPLAITGYAGTINKVVRGENAKVWSGTQIFTLKDTTHTANYDALLRSRSELEETLLELLKLQKHGGITATVNGTVFSVADLDAEEEESTTTSTSASSAAMAALAMGTGAGTGTGTGAEEENTDIVVLSPDIQMSVTISVDESDILALKLDQKADVTVSSVSEDVLAGVVTEIDKTAADGSYTAVITLDKIPGMLQGMTADVDVKIEGVEDAIIIPVDALNQTSTDAFVYTSYDEQTQTYGGRVDVISGLSNDEYVEITSGLKVGDTVYYTEKRTVFNFAAMGYGNMGGSGGNRGGLSVGMPGGRG